MIKFEEEHKKAKQELRFKIKHKITSNQLDILNVFLFNDVSYFYEYFDQMIRNTPYFKESASKDIDYLINKGYLKGRWFDSQDYPENTTIKPVFKSILLDYYNIDEEGCKKFIKEFSMKEKEYIDWVNNLVKVYPGKNYHNGQENASLHKMKDEKLNIYDLKSFGKYYLELINHDEETHQKLLKAIRMYEDSRKNALLGVNIVNFFSGGSWLKLIQEAEEKGGIKTNSISI